MKDWKDILYESLEDNEIPKWILHFKKNDMKYYTRRFTEAEITLMRQVFEYYLDSPDSNGDDEAEEFYNNELKYEHKKYI